MGIFEVAGIIKKIREVKRDSRESTWFVDIYCRQKIYDEFHSYMVSTRMSKRLIAEHNLKPGMDIVVRGHLSGYQKYGEWRLGLNASEVIPGYRKLRNEKIETAFDEEEFENIF